MIDTVCHECGISANVLTCLRKYGKRPNKLCFDVSGMWKGKCEACGKEGSVTSARDFFYPDFDLLKRRTIYIKKDK